MNHPNRGAIKGPGANPDPADIVAARHDAGLTQQQAAELIFSTLRTWQDWEAGARRMHPGLFMLFNLRTARKRKTPRTLTLDRW